MPNGDEENLRQEKSYWTSLEGNAGHFGADLCVLTVWYRGDQPVKWQMTEERWDLAGNGVNFRTQSGPETKGAPPANIGELPPPAMPPDYKGTATSFMLFPIDKAGYDAAKKWAKAQEPPGKADPPYDPEKYNCGAFAMAFYGKTNAKEIPPPELKKPGPIIPGNILSWIRKLKEWEKNHRQKVCIHEWEKRFVFRLNADGDWASDRPFYYACRLCGMTKPE